MKNILVIGSGLSGIGACKLAKSKGHDVMLTDSKKINSKVKEFLNSMNISYEEETHSNKNLEWANEIIISPGISKNTDYVKLAIEKKIPIISEIEFASRFTNKPIIAVTGSNGKTTTCSLLYYILKNANLNPRLCGNIGVSFSEVLTSNPGDVYVLEVSSFQLENILKFKPNISILLNLSPDHLDRYNNNKEYYFDTKMLIQKNQNEKDFFIYSNEDSNISSRISNSSKQKLHSFGNLNKSKNTSAWVDDNQLIIKNNKNLFTMLLHEMALQGKHNVYNSMAAGIASKILGVSNDVLRMSLINFKGVEHRLEKVLKLDGRVFINDSKATNCNAVYFALESINSPIVWICGGVDKGNNYDQLNNLVKDKVHTIVVMGKSSKKIINHFKEIVPNIIKVDDMQSAVSKAYRLGKNGDSILLSPACSSFDQFQNYEERGRVFKECVFSL
jgi:UDP-N-acetylmuramoylalanine--D-glutamate ligase